MDRRVGAVALLLVAAACGGKRGGGAGSDAGAKLAPLPVPVAERPDAAPDLAPDAAPLAEADVLEGAEAERAVASAQLSADAGAETPEVVGIGPERVGPYRLGQSRAEVLALAPVRLDVQPGPPGAVREELGVLTSTGGPWLRLRLRAGRLVELEVLARDGRALTDEGIGVGSGFEEAVLAHGDPRPLMTGSGEKLIGWVLTELPGVVFVAGKPAAPPAKPKPGAPDAGPPEPPPGEARITRILVLGPESTALED